MAHDFMIDSLQEDSHCILKCGKRVSDHIACQLAHQAGVDARGMPAPLKPDGFAGILDGAPVQRFERAQLAGSPLGRLPQLLDRLALQPSRAVPMHMLLGASL